MLIFGWIGGIINAFHILPQVIRIQQRKSTNDISLFSLFIKLLATILYTVHGLIINDPPLLYMTAIMVVQYFIIICQYKYYYKGSECDASTVESRSSTTTTTNMQKDLLVSSPKREDTASNQTLSTT